MKNLKNPFRKTNKNIQDHELLEKLKTIEKFHSELISKEKIEEIEQKEVLAYAENEHFKPIIERFANFHFIVENQVKTTQLRTFSNYFEIFSTYIEALLTPFKRGGLEKHIKVEIKSEFVNQRLKFSLLISNLKFSREDLVNRDLKRTIDATGHLLTPFRGKIKHYMKKSPNRQVKAILIQMELTPLRQHIPNFKIQNH